MHFCDVPDVQVIAEPGRFYASTAFTLCCSVIAKTVVLASRINKCGSLQLYNFNLLLHTYTNGKLHLCNVDSCINDGVRI